MTACVGEEVIEPMHLHSGMGWEFVSSGGEEDSDGIDHTATICDNS